MVNFSRMKISIKTILFITIIVFFVLADRFLKILSLRGLLDRPVPLLGNIFALHYVKNFYIAFSLPFSGPILTAVIGLIILILLIYWLNFFIPNTKHQTLITNLVPLTFLIIGAILNFTDRVKYGFVIDYFDLKYFTVFNLADIMIVVSVIYLVFILRRRTK